MHQVLDKQEVTLKPILLSKNESPLFSKIYINGNNTNVHIYGNLLAFVFKHKNFYLLFVCDKANLFNDTPYSIPTLTMIYLLDTTLNKIIFSDTVAYDYPLKIEDTTIRFSPSVFPTFPFKLTLYKNGFYPFIWKKNFGLNKAENKKYLKLKRKRIFFYI